MKKLFLLLALLCWARVGLATSPHVLGDRLAPAELGAQVARVARKLQAEGFVVVGRHQPLGMRQFMGIVRAPDLILHTMERAAGVEAP